MNRQDMVGPHTKFRSLFERDYAGWNRKVSYRYHPIFLDIAMGKVNLIGVKREYEALLAGRRFIELARQANVSVSKATKQNAGNEIGEHIERLEAILRDFSRFDQTDILVSNDDFAIIKKAFGNTQTDETAISEQQGSVVSRILAMAEADPSLTKTQIRDQIGGVVSVRCFNQFWANAVEKNPDLAKPGRKPRNS